MPESPVVELSFGIRGDAIPLDHGYLCFAAVARLVPDLHAGDLGWQILPIRGRYLVAMKLSLGQESRLGIRLPAEQVPQALGLSGQTLRIGAEQITLGVPDIRNLRPVEALVSRLVTIKGGIDVETFRAALRRKMSEMEIPAGVDSEIGERRVMRVAGRTIVGFPVRLSDLDANTSLRVQSTGIGGKRRMAAGIFLPERGQA